MKWSDENWVDKETLNGGEKFADGNGISAEVFNAIVENIFYLIKKVGAE